MKHFLEVLQRFQHVFTINQLPDMNLKPKQVKTFEALLCNRDVLAVLPTGFGKSLLFQLLPDLYQFKETDNSIVIVVTPLTSIIEDQVEVLRKYGISCYALKERDSKNSIPSLFAKTVSSTKSVSSDDDDDDDNDDDDNSSEEDGEVYKMSFPKDVLEGKVKIILCHPEAILSSSGRELMRSKPYKIKVKACVIDEAHCVDIWGKEFRKEFKNLSALRAYFPKVPMLALTATAPQQTVKVIAESLQLENYYLLNINPNRSNIFLEKHLRLDTFYGLQGYDNLLLPIANQLKEEMLNFPQTIIYCRLKYCGYAYRLFEKILGEKQYCDRVYTASHSLFVQFHSPQTNKMKEEILEEIKKAQSRIRIIFATSALGMGVNAPFIDQVIHIGPSSSLEQYMQEFGRAGRSGKQARAILYYTNSEIGDNKVKCGLVDPSVQLYCRSESKCLRKMLLHHFGFSATSVKQVICCSICNSDMSTAITECEKVNTKYRYLSLENMNLLASALDDLLANLDANVSDNAAELFFGKISSDDIADNIASMLTNAEYIKDIHDLFAYNIWDESVSKDIFILLEKFSTIL